MRPNPASLFRLTTLAASLAVAGTALAQGGAPGYQPRRAEVVRADSARPLADARAGTPEQAVAGVLRTRGHDDASVRALHETARSPGRGGVQHLRFEQRTTDGLTVYGAYAKATFDARGAMVMLIDRLARVPAGSIAAPQVDAAAALRAAMARVHPGVKIEFKPLATQGATSTFDGGAFFDEAPSVTAVAVPLSDGTLARGWLVETWTSKTNQLHQTLVSGKGKVLEVQNRTANDSYKVFTNAPDKTPQAVVAGPGSGNAESPAGWLSGFAEKSIRINGNNVDAYLDADANNRPDAGGTRNRSKNFLATADLTQTPKTATNREVAVQNLFYVNNVIHDILYRHGFDEAAGNFQVDNFGKGGAGADAVRAEAQDGGGTDNANFSTPPDGRKPRMQMYLWTGAGFTHELQITTPVAVTYGAMGAAFGPALTTGGLSGAIVAALPADGCSAIGAGVSGKVALVDRGTCSFTIKVKNAQLAGATAVVVANNTGGTEAFTMGGSDATITIPSVMITQNDGAALRGMSAPSGTMRLKAVQPLQIDASLDSDVIYHEYGHGLTWRMIGDMSGPLAGAIGEGMGDVLAMLVNGDDRMGEYSASDPNGIRRYPYAGYPLTYADVTGAEVHNDGEIYAAIGWRLIELFGPARREDLIGHLVDGMNYTPSAPTYEQMRDGILASVAASATPGDRCTIWSAFAQFGVGVGAQGVVNPGGSVTITPSFSVPGDCP